MCVTRHTFDGRWAAERDPGRQHVGTTGGSPHPAGDLRRMFANARVYNAPESIFFKISEKLEAAFNNMLATMLVLDGQ